MKIFLGILAIVVSLAMTTLGAAPASSRFTYQGVLEQSNVVANGAFDLRFQPFGVLSGGTSLATAIALDNVAVVNGVFTVSLDFGEGFFVGDQVFLQIDVRDGASTGVFTGLAPRQELTATPYAQTALGLVDGGSGLNVHLNRIGHKRTSLASTPSQSPSIIVGADGYPIVSFYDPVNGDLRVAHCTDVACRSSDVTTIDSAGIVGEFSSIIIRSTNGLPAISYYDRSNGNLKLAYCTTTSCSSSTIETIDSSGDVGLHTSAVSGDDLFGAILIFYYDATNGDLKHVRCAQASCASPAFTALDSGGDVGQFTSAAVGAGSVDSQLVWVSYYDVTSSAIKVVACINFGCGGGGAGIVSVTPRNVATGVSGVSATSVTVGGDNRAWIAYNNGTVTSLARCDSPTTCTTNTQAAISSIVGNVSLTRGTDGVVWIAGRKSDGRIGAGRCDAADACGFESVWSLTSTAVGSQSGVVSMALGMDGIPIAAAGGTNSLTLVHCSSATLCIEGAWPR